MGDPYSTPPVLLNGRRRPPVFIDLFAGSGGLGLGLELAGFAPVFVNELDPVAMATYIGNRLRRYPQLIRNSVDDVAELTGGFSGGGSNGRLVSWAASLQARYGDIDLIAGGPPCQGYSAIGHRRSFAVERAEVPSNHLYRDMAWIIQAVRPKLFLFENVANLERARWGTGGEPGEIWRDVLATFENIGGYAMHAEKVLAKDYGVPQNRPRLLLVGIRDDLGFQPQNGRNAFGLLPVPIGSAPDPEDLLGDLVDPAYQPGGVTERYPRSAATLVQQWFRFDPVSVAPYRQGDLISDHIYSKHSPRIAEKFRHMIETGAIRPEDRTAKFSQRVLPRLWAASGPNVTATSMPDDLVHYDQPRTLTVREWARLQTFPDWYQFYGQRTTGGRRRAGNPEVGDWAREVPKYTQIGNAVPVLLARAIGEHLRQFVT